MAVAFDLKAPTFRHKMYDGYKQGRHPTPEDLLLQFDDAKECLKYMGIHVMELVGYEADDIQNILAWFKWYWYGEYDCGGCAFTVYKNGIELEFDELWELGFIK